MVSSPSSSRCWCPGEQARAAAGVRGYSLAILVGYLVNPLFARGIFLLLPIFFSLTSSGLYELRRLRRMRHSHPRHPHSRR
ncbi:hypothetical protein [Micromonospora sp. NPDC005203]|uniref:hypothetical protein n=1 Tax=Micromonospora sp. NPDC005203 TaxID=3364226 RepID=UPI00367CE11D